MIEGSDLGLFSAKLNLQRLLFDYLKIRTTISDHFSLPGFAISRQPKPTSLFDLADQAAALSSQVLAARLTISGLSHGQKVQLEQFEKDLDKIATGARSSGVHHIHSTGVSAASDLKSIYWRGQDQFINRCTNAIAKDDTCRSFLADLEKLIH